MQCNFRRSVRSCRLFSSKTNQHTAPQHIQALKKNVSVKDMHNIPLNTQHLLEPFTNEEWQVVEKSHFEKFAQVPKDWANNLDKLQTTLDWKFSNVIHLKCAMTHFGRFQSSTVPHFPSNRVANRSLEWLGDSALNTTVAIYLFQSYPLMQEGQLTQLRSALIKNSILSRISEQLGLPDVLLLGSCNQHIYTDESPGAQRMKQTLHASALEALIGAVLVDQGMTKAIEFVNTRILPLAIQYAQDAGHSWDPTSEFYVRAEKEGISLRFDRIEGDNFLHTITLYANNKPILTQKGGSFKAIQRSISAEVLQSWGKYFP